MYTLDVGIIAVEQIMVMIIKEFPRTVVTTTQLPWTVSGLTSPMSLMVTINSDYMSTQRNSHQRVIIGTMSLRVTLLFIHVAVNMYGSRLGSMQQTSKLLVNANYGI